MEAAAPRVNTTTETDLDLVTRHQYGDESAFEEIYDRYGAMIFNLALRMCSDMEEAADLSQETFLKIHRHLSGFRGRSSLRTWLYRVAINCCRSRLRGQRARRNRELPDPEDHLHRLADQRRGPEEKAMARDVGDRVVRALDRLPTIYREAVLLRDIEELTYREISLVLGLRLGTVRSRIARGRDRLRGFLEESK